MLVFTTEQYRRLNLTNDSLLTRNRGRRSPTVIEAVFDSVWGAILAERIECSMSHYALFLWVYPHAVTLMWLQVLAVVEENWWS